MKKVNRVLILSVILSAAVLCAPTAASAEAAEIFFTQSEYDNVIWLSYGASVGENWVRTDDDDASLNAVVTAHKNNGDQIGDPIAVPADALGRVDYGVYITQGIKNIKVVFQGKEYSKTVQIFYMVFRCEQLENQNRVLLTTYAFWPNESYPVSTEGGDGWPSEVKAYDADRNELGPVDVPDSAEGVADYSAYISAGIKYLRVKQGDNSSQYFEVQVYPIGPTDPEPKDEIDKENGRVKQETGREVQIAEEATSLPKTDSTANTPPFLGLILLAAGFYLQRHRFPDQAR